jgi:hypothetical protein
MKISRLDANVVRVLFVNANGQDIPIPQGVILASDGDVIVPQFQNSFFITWVAN